ncbi:hypothetical protein ACFWBF_34130 [Streptomyces sp. NPDC060028]|uniref:hypothetical protein n=1 Tax=Streptomyces sp. NPDC060028 TaxID=3347041 RepID=UPI00368E222F
MTTTLLDVTAPPRLTGLEMPEESGDERARFYRITNEYPDEQVEAARQAFLLSKIHLLRTHPTLEFDEREAMLSALTSKLDLDSLSTQEPVPGGVGYGFYYNDPFKKAFATGTSLGWDVICPNTPGGNVNNFLYVTAMNRAVRGLEAYVHYFAQTPPRFKVYDWARPSTPWQLDMPWSSMGEYLRNVSSHGQTLQVLGITNTTVEVAGGMWRNEVQLWNAARNRHDLVYQFDYPATLAQQTAADFNGTWAPIVETFQTSYSGTRPLGALGTSLCTRDSAGNWSPWALLAWYQSYVRTDNVGFRVQFLDQNYNYAVTS